MIYNEDFETLPREVLETLQLKRLKQVVQRVYHTVGFYRRAFDEAGVQPDDLKSLDDLRKFPFTTKQDLRDNYPFGMLAGALPSGKKRQPEASSSLFTLIRAVASLFAI